MTAEGDVTSQYSLGTDNSAQSCATIVGPAQLHYGNADNCLPCGTTPPVKQRHHLQHEHTHHILHCVCSINAHAEQNTSKLPLCRAAIHPQPCKPPRVGWLYAYPAIKMVSKAQLGHCKRGFDIGRLLVLTAKRPGMCATEDVGLRK